MDSKHRESIFRIYNSSREFFIQHSNNLIAVEQYVTEFFYALILSNYHEFMEDYNEASYLHPFWANYPPDDRGRSPVGDQIPWIEVGEHAIGHKLNRFISKIFSIRETGLPSGADNRFLLKSERILEITQGLTDSIMVFLDIKSVGPRDDFEHTVISPYQVSGDGKWDSISISMLHVYRFFALIEYSKYHGCPIRTMPLSANESGQL